MIEKTSAKKGFAPINPKRPYIEGIPLHEWIIDAVKNLDKNLIYSNGLSEQFQFVYHALHGIFIESYKESQAHPVRVVGTHRSKSVTLPVYSFVWKGVEFRLRYNFYDWKVSVCSDREVPDKFGEGLFTRGNDIPAVYCEGFDDEWVFPPYPPVGANLDQIGYNAPYSRKNFTVELRSKYQLYTFCYLIKTGLENV